MEDLNVVQYKITNAGFPLVLSMGGAHTHPMIFFQPSNPIIKTDYPYETAPF